MTVLIEKCNEGDLLQFRNGDLGLVLKMHHSARLVGVMHRVLGCFKDGLQIFYLPERWEVVLLVQSER